MILESIVMRFVKHIISRVMKSWLVSHLYIILHFENILHLLKIRSIYIEENLYLSVMWEWIILKLTF